MTDWPHTPPHRTLQKGTYMITAATYKKIRYFQTKEDLQFLHDSLLNFANQYGWKLQAWAIFANHYHFIAESSDNPQNLSSFISEFHVGAARYINSKDSTLNRQVWWQFWDSHITFPYSYFARLNYVNQNPVRHGLVNLAENYPWCSANWFQKTAVPSFYKTVTNFKIDNVKVIDDF